jgi:hypothetical protein
MSCAMASGESLVYLFLPMILPRCNSRDLIRILVSGSTSVYIPHPPLDIFCHAAPRTSAALLGVAPNGPDPRIKNSSDRTKRSTGRESPLDPTRPLKIANRRDGISESFLRSPRALLRLINAQAIVMNRVGGTVHLRRLLRD